MGVGGRSDVERSLAKGWVGSVSGKGFSVRKDTCPAPEGGVSVLANARSFLPALPLCPLGISLKPRLLKVKFTQSASRVPSEPQNHKTSEPGALGRHPARVALHGVPELLR